MMKYLLSTFIILFFIILSFPVGSNTALKAGDDFKKGDEQNDECIIELMRHINVDSKLDKFYYEKLLQCFKYAELRENTTFMTKEGDDTFFYSKIDILKDRSKYDINSLWFLVNLDFVIRRNVEIAEFLSRLMPELALQNTKGFVIIYKDLNLEQKDLLISALEYFKGPAKYNKFKDNLDLIDNELKKYAQDLKYKLENYIMNE